MDRTSRRRHVRLPGATWSRAAALAVALAVLPGCTAAPDLGGSSPSGDAPSVGPTTLERGDDGDLQGRTVSIDDTDVAAIAGLDPGLSAAVTEAAAAAAADGVEVRITSGWRSPELQQRLLDDAAHRYGSYDEARRWVQTPDGSSHVTGDAVDIGPTDAAYWMAEHGGGFGLCQTYANEIWHYELAVRPGQDCPPPVADPAEQP